MARKARVVVLVASLNGFRPKPRRPASSRPSLSGNRERSHWGVENVHPQRGRPSYLANVARQPVALVRHGKSLLARPVCAGGSMRAVLYNTAAVVLRFWQGCREHDDGLSQEHEITKSQRRL